MTTEQMNTPMQTALQLLIPRKVGFVNGQQQWSRPAFRAAILVLIANGRTVLINGKLHMPPGAFIDGRNPKGAVFVANEIDCNGSPRQPIVTMELEA